MGKIIGILVALVLSSKAFSQLSGVINVPSTYTSIASVVQILNQQGIAGHVTVAINSGYTETAPVNGYSLIATGNSTSSITFQNSGVGANPLISAYAGGSGTPGSLNQDGIWRLIGCDYVTIEGIDFIDLNTTNPQTMEFGIGLFKLNGIDGCQHNTIKNCVITLNRINNAGGNSPAMEGSRGINMVNSTSNANTTVLTVFSIDGSNSNNRFYSNVIQNCNIAIALIGYPDVSPFNFADKNNDVGGNSSATGNTLINFGGGGSTSASAGIKTLAQYDLNLSYNFISNNTGSGTNHPGIIRGVYLNAASNANTSIHHNTLTISGGGTSSQVYVIENNSGSTGNSNTVSISNNLITKCNYSTSVSGPFYGIYNTGSPSFLNINSNSFVQNSTTASSGSNYLIYNVGVASNIHINDNKLSFNYDGALPYSGTMYTIYNTASVLSGSLTINGNNFSNFNHLNAPGNGALYFIYNSGDFSSFFMNENYWSGLIMNHDGPEYFMYNTSSTQNRLAVNSNTITNHTRNGISANTYCYYAAATSPGSAIQTFSNNLFSDISSAVAGSGNFYGIYNTEGNSSSYPKKEVFGNTIKNINVNGTGAMYGIHITNMGDAGSNSGSKIYNNIISDLHFNDVVYGLYVASPTSSLFAANVYSNVVYNISSNGVNTNAYGCTLGSNNAGVYFYKNRISDIIANGSTGAAHGVYCISTSSTVMFNNSIANIKAPFSTGANRVNGIFISAGTLYNIFYNTVHLNAASAGTAFSSNAIYASTSASLDLRNNIFINNSIPSGAGICAAYRRSSASLSSYLTGSDHNLFYAGFPGANQVIFYNGTTAYQTLAGFQAAMGTREANSVTQNTNFFNTNITSPNFLHVIPNVLSLAEGGATPVLGIGEDMDSEIRQGNIGYLGSGTSPDIGADEFEQDMTPCNAASAGSISAIMHTLCAGQTTTLLSEGYTSGTGISHQWKVANQSGGPYLNVTGGFGANGIEHSTPTMTAGTYYFILETTCSHISQSAASSEVMLVVNPVPSASASVASSLICSGQSVILNGASSGNATYNWIGPYGFNSSATNPSITNVTSGASGTYSLKVVVNNCASSISTVALVISEVTLALGSSNSFLCNGDVSTLTVNGSAINYSWSTGVLGNSIVVSPSITTTYSLIATNNFNCSKSASVLITALNPTISGSGVLICESTPFATLSVNAFTPSVINWYATPSSTLALFTGSNFTVTSLISTTYYSEAQSGFCTSPRIPISLTVSPNPIVLITLNPATVCPGKPSVLSASGANTYSWTLIGSGSTKTVFPQSTTSYTIKGTDSQGCSDTETVSVMTYSVPIINAVQSSSLVCPSSKVTFTASGAGSYTWNTGTIGDIANVSPAINSTYTVYGSNPEGCVSTATLGVITKSVPVISIIQSSSSVCSGESVTFAASGAMSYTWLPGNILATTFTAAPVVSAVYNVIGKSINSCTAVSFAGVSVDPCVGVSENLFVNKEVSVFPNPTQGITNLTFKFEGKKIIKVFDSTGALMHESENNTAVKTLDFYGLPKGLYFVIIYFDNNKSCNKLVVN